MGALFLLATLACLVLVVYAFDGGDGHGTGHGFHRAGDRWVSVVAGTVGTAFFGGGGVYFVWKKLREPRLLTLSERGITVQSGGFIPWENLEAVGTGRTAEGPYGAKIIGIRVKSQEHFIGTMTEGEIRSIRAVAKAGRFVGLSLPRRATRPGHQAVLNTLTSMPHHGALAVLQWTRKTSGWDLSWPPLLFNRRSGTVVRMIEDYHQDVTNRRSTR